MAQAPKRPFFNAGALPDPKLEYVAWLDVMGVRAIMSRSLPTSANFVFKLHTTVLEAPHQPLRLYPVMDGVYVASERQEPLLVFLEHVLACLAAEFVAEKSRPKYQFVVKAAVAYGPVVHGCDVPATCSNTLANKPAYRDGILIGMPMVQAIQREPNAPPFGVSVHESARAFSPAGEAPLTDVWWRWFRNRWRPLAKDLRAALDKYYDWCAARSQAIEYDAERIAAHRHQAEQYLVDL